MSEEKAGHIYSAISAIMAEINAISKGRENKAQGYKFRGIDDVYNEVHPLLTKHKVFTVPEVLEANYDTVTTAKGSTLFYSRLKMQYTFFADDGSCVRAVVIGEGMDSGDKASNKAMAVAHKYAIVQMFAIPTDEPKDPENDSPEVVVPQAKRAEPKDEKTILREQYQELFKRGFFTPADKAVMDAAMKEHADNLPSLRFLIDKYMGNLRERKHMVEES